MVVQRSVIAAAKLTFFVQPGDGKQRRLTLPTNCDYLSGKSRVENMAIFMFCIFMAMSSGEFATSFRYNYGRKRFVRRRMSRINLATEGHTWFTIRSLLPKVFLRV